MLRKETLVLNICNGGSTADNLVIVYVANDNHKSICVPLHPIWRIVLKAIVMHLLVFGTERNLHMTSESKTFSAREMNKRVTLRSKV